MRTGTFMIRQAARLIEAALSWAELRLFVLRLRLLLWRPTSSKFRVERVFLPQGFVFNYGLYCRACVDKSWNESWEERATRGVVAPDLPILARIQEGSWKCGRCGASVITKYAESVV